MLLLKAVLLSSLWAFALGQLEQPEIVISRATDKSASIPCKASTNNFRNVDIHWYRQKPKQEFEHLMYVRTSYNQRPLGGTNKKLEASKNFDTSASTLKINVLKKEDEATYYCTYWDLHSVKAVRMSYTRTPPGLCPPT
ncbi:T-cell receptor gamma chain V region V108B [Fukomys damarensis]|nr:T-cell receptor gamma chain V region V108B [Fukomys damarensis]